MGSGKELSEDERIGRLVTEIPTQVGVFASRIHKW